MARTIDASPGTVARLPERRWWLWYLVSTVTVVAAGPLLPEVVQQVLYLLLGITVVGCVVAAIRRHRPGQPLPWLLLVASLSVPMGVNLWWAAEYASGAVVTFPTAADWVYLLMYPLLTAALAALPAPAAYGSRWAAIVDAAIVTCAAGVLSWTLLINPYLSAAPVSTATLVSALAYPVLDLMVVSMAARLVLLGGARTPSRLFIVAAATALLVADTDFFITLMRDEPPSGGPLAVAAWLLCYVFLGAAALHPSMARRTSIATPLVTDRYARLAIYIPLVLLGPAATGWSLLSKVHTGTGIGALDVIVPGLATAVTSVLLVVRLAQLTGVAQRRAADLDARTTALEAALHQQAMLQEELIHRAMHDTLTGLANRALLHKRVDGALAVAAVRAGRAGRAGRVGDPGRAHGLLLLDLDGFKDVNDNLGHPAGDQLLVAVADRLRDVVSAADTLARLGGDEFAILTTESTEDGGDGDVADRLRGLADEVLRTMGAPFTVADQQVHISTSIGMVGLHPHASTAEVLRDADLALYAAKAAGKNQAVAYHHRLRAERLSHARLVEQLHRALGRDEFTLYYQPIVDLSDGSVVAVESLLRWVPQGHACVGPDQFIPAAESSGLIVPIGAWVLRRACTEARAWHDRYGITLSVNVSARQLRDPEFAAVAERALLASGLPPRALTLEITESVLVDTTAEAQQVIAHLTRLRDSGVRVAIDDFGTGYSSLAYLRDLPVDALKIDRSFIAADHDDAGSDRIALTRAIIDLATSLQLSTVAEGVESAGQAQYLRALRCTLAQGHHFAAPLPLAAVQEYLAERARPARAVATGTVATGAVATGTTGAGTTGAGTTATGPCRTDDAVVR